MIGIVRRLSKDQVDFSMKAVFPVPNSIKVFVVVQSNTAGSYRPSSMPFDHFRHSRASLSAKIGAAFRIKKFAYRWKAPSLPQLVIEVPGYFALARNRFSSAVSFGYGGRQP
jgi:hypothetical protein